MDAPPNLPSAPASGNGRPPGDRRAMKVARLSVITASLLGAMKLTAASMTGSMAIAGSFVDSLTDVFASSVNLVAIRIGSRPADDDHRFGHGKAEGLAGMFQGAVIGFSGFFLVTESVRRLLEHRTAEREMTGVIVMAIACVASVWITWLLRRTAKATGSVALLADSAHYASDVYMNGGVLASLLLERFTHWEWLDPVVGLLVAAIVLKSSWTVLRASMDELMDRDLGARVEDEIRRAVLAVVPEARDVRSIRTRRSGRARFVDLMVAFDRDLSFAEAHRLSERARSAVLTAVPDADVSVHADPDPLLPDDHPAG